MGSETELKFKVGVLIFTLVFLYAAGIGSKVGNTLVLGLIALTLTYIQFTFIPHVFTFAFVNTWITLTFTIVDIITKANQGITYGIVFCLVNTAPLFEAISCEVGTFAQINYGGHVIFDGSIIVGLITLFIASELTHVSTEKKKA